MLSIGIHIGKHSACFAELSAEGGKLKEATFFEERFFDPSDSEEKKLSSVFQRIEEIQRKHKGKALRFCLGLPQSLISSFFISFPFKEKFKILKTLPFEIEDKSPFPSEKVFFDARISRIQGKNSQAICFAAPAENIQPFLEKPLHKGKAAFSLSCEGAALANVLEFWNKPLSQPQTLSGSALRIYLGMENSLIFCYKEGYLIDISLLDWGILPIVKEMEGLYQLSLQKAREEFFAKAFILSSATAWSKDQVFFSNLIKKHISGLIPKLKLLKISIETKQKLAIKEALIFGPGAVIKNLSVFLSTELSIHISKVRNLPAFAFFHWTDKPSFLPAFGLALEGLKSSPYKGLDFLHSYRKDAFSLFPKKWRATAFAGLLCFAFFTAYVFIRKTESQKILDKSQNTFKSYGSKITGFRTKKLHPENLKSFLEEEKKKMALKQKILVRLNSPNPMDRLSFISKELKKTSAQWGLSLSYLEMEEGKIDIRGFIGKTFLEEFESKLKSFSKKGVLKTGALKKEKVKLKNPPPTLKNNEKDAQQQVESVAHQPQVDGLSTKARKALREPLSTAKSEASPSSPSKLSASETPPLTSPLSDKKPKPFIIGGKDGQKADPSSAKTRENTKEQTEDRIGDQTKEPAEDQTEEIEKVFFSYSFEFKESLFTAKTYKN